MCKAGDERVRCGRRVRREERPAETIAERGLAAVLGIAVLEMTARVQRRDRASCGGGEGSRRRVVSVMVAVGGGAGAAKEPLREGVVCGWRVMVAVERGKEVLRRCAEVAS